MNTKKCSVCKKVKQDIEFHKKINAKDGLRSSCKDCTNESNRNSFNKSDRKSKTEEVFRAKEVLAQEGAKYCRTCDSYKSIEKFYKAKSGKDGHCGTCNDCHSNDGKDRYHTIYKDTDELKQRIFRERILRDYKLTVEDYNLMLEEQNFSCKICKTHISNLNKPLYIDHDHSCCSGSSCCGLCVRGLLCMKCNAGLGMFNDKVENLEEAIRYLLNNQL